VVTRLARRLASVDEGARSSTLQDLDRGRATEIGDLNGAIVRLATSAGRRAPVNERVTDVVRRHEAAVLRGEKPQFVPAGEILFSAQ
jgi:2-dehydropantoate 2-reductase